MAFINNENIQLGEMDYSDYSEEGYVEEGELEKEYMAEGYVEEGFVENKYVQPQFNMQYIYDDEEEEDKCGLIEIGYDDDYTEDEESEEEYDYE